MDQFPARYFFDSLICMTFERPLSVTFDNIYLFFLHGKKSNDPLTLLAQTENFSVHFFSYYEFLSLARIYDTPDTLTLNIKLAVLNISYSKLSLMPNW